MIISGGQTGADQGGLIAGDSLRSVGIKTGGYAPDNFKTDIGSDLRLKDLGLKEYGTYPERTEANVNASNATVIFGNPDSPGCKLTLKLCRLYKKPAFVVLWQSGEPMPLEHRNKFTDWLIANEVKVLNVAGNRERTNPGITGMVANFLIQVVLGEVTIMPRVLNKHTASEFDKNNAIYIGRPSPYGNPFTHISEGTLAKYVVDKSEVIPAFERYLLSNRELMLKVKRDLRGRDLLCFCSPRACHGDILLKYANSPIPRKTNLGA